MTLFDAFCSHGFQARQPSFALEFFSIQSASRTWKVCRSGSYVLWLLRWRRQLALLVLLLCCWRCTTGLAPCQVWLRALSVGTIATLFPAGSGQRWQLCGFCVWTAVWVLSGQPWQLCGFCVWTAVTAVWVLRLDSCVGSVSGQLCGFCVWTAVTAVWVLCLDSRDSCVGSVSGQRWQLCGFCVWTAVTAVWVLCLDSGDSCVGSVSGQRWQLCGFCVWTAVTAVWVLGLDSCVGSVSGQLCGFCVWTAVTAVWVLCLDSGNSCVSSVSGQRWQLCEFCVWTAVTAVWVLGLDSGDSCVGSVSAQRWQLCGFCVCTAVTAVWVLLSLISDETAPLPLRFKLVSPRPVCCRCRLKLPFGFLYLRNHSDIMLYPLPPVLLLRLLFGPYLGVKFESSVKLHAEYSQPCAFSRPLPFSMGSWCAQRKSLTMSRYYKWLTERWRGHVLHGQIYMLASVLHVLLASSESLESQVT